MEKKALAMTISYDELQWSGTKVTKVLACLTRQHHDFHTFIRISQKHHITKELTQCRHLLEICFKNRERLDLRTSGLKYGMEGHKFKLNLQYVCKS